MLTICVFRRFGIAVPVLLFLIGLLLEKFLDAKYGTGFYTEHTWVLGLNLLVTGVLTGLLSCVVDRPSDCAYATIGDIEDVRQSVQSSLHHFVHDETEDDMFCYIPLNRCAIALMIAGTVLILLGWMLP